MHRLIPVFVLGLVGFSATAQVPSETTLLTLKEAARDEASEAMIDTAHSMGVDTPSQVFDVTATEPIRVLKAETPDETFLLIRVLYSGETVSMLLAGVGDDKRITLWDGGPQEAVISSKGILIQARSDARGDALQPTSNGAIETLLCLGRAIGVDFTNLTSSGWTNLISKATCSGANSLALILTAANCLSIPAPAAIAGCAAGFAQVIGCGIATCATCQIGTITRGSTINDSLADGCQSTHRSGRYARFYSFTLNQRTTVTIDVASASFDTYAYLLQGNGTSGSVLAYDDDSGPGTNSRIVLSLSAGKYTIEATAYDRNSTGRMSISLR